MFNNLLDVLRLAWGHLSEQKLLPWKCPKEAIWPRGYKTFFVLNSVEHEISNAHKYKNIKKFGLFKAQLSLECYFSCSYMLKCQQFVGILTFMSGENFMLN